MRFPEASQVADAREGVSQTYAEFIQTRGYGLVRGGRFQFCPADEYRPIVALIFKADPDFSHNDTRILGYDAFGMDVVAWSEKHNLVNIDLLEYKVRCMALAGRGQHADAYPHGADGAGQPRDPDQIDYADQPRYRRVLGLDGRKDV